MKEESRIPSSFGYIDAIIQIVIGIVAIGYAMVMTPVVFWLPAWGILVAVFSYAMGNRDGSHWPSTIFGAIELIYIGALLVMLAISNVSSYALANLFFGMLMLHGILYAIAAKPFLIRRGYLKPPKS